jgi:DUF1680 family protein
MSMVCRKVVMGAMGLMGVFAWMMVGGWAAPWAVADVLEPVGLTEVKVGGEIGRRVEATIANNLLVLDADRDFLPAFKAENRKGAFIGLGILLDATVKLAAYSDDPKVHALRKHLVDEIIAVQEPDGYIGTMQERQRISKIWDVHEMGYVIYGLLQDHAYFGEDRSLTAARRAADYLIANWSKLPPDYGVGAEVAPHVAFTGIERTMLALHRATGEAAYLEFVTKTRGLTDWNLGIVIGRRPGIEGHVYAYLARALAQLELHRTHPAPPLLGPAHQALSFMTQSNGMLITGSCGQCEIWTDDQDTRGDVGETCALAYQIRLQESLFRMNGEARMGDLIERTIHNALFASQSPDGRQLRYFAPLEGDRVYFPRDSYCCPNNYRRIIAELPGMIYYRAADGADGLTVNLYTASQANVKLATGQTVAIRQDTDYPTSGKVRVLIDPQKPAAFTLRLRIPAWARGSKVTINDEPVADAEAGKFFAVRRTWKPGDTLELVMPMDWRLVAGRQRQAGRVALMRGPVVFTLDPSQHEELGKLDAADLGYIALDPASLSEPVSSDAVRPGGVGARVKFWKAGFGLGQKTDYELTLTEFADPHGKATYFRLRDYSTAVDDELLSP